MAYQISMVTYNRKPILEKVLNAISMALDMAPSLTADQMGNNGLAYLILQGQALLRNVACCIALTNGLYLILHQFGRTASLASWHAFRGRTRAASITEGHAPLTSSIFGIVLTSSKKQVLRPHTNAIANIASRIIHVARVAHLHAFGDWAIVKNPRDTVSRQIPCAFIGMPKLQPAVATTINWPLPEPATISFQNARPKTLSKGYAAPVFVIAWGAAKLVWVWAILRSKRRAASGANCDRMVSHDRSPFDCAMLPDVPASRGLLVALLYNKAGERGIICSA